MLILNRNVYIINMYTGHFVRIIIIVAMMYNVHYIFNNNYVYNYCHVM